MAAGSSYYFTVNVTTISGATAQAVVSVFIMPSDIILSIPGGALRTVPVDQQLVLDATITDPLFTTTLTYEWSCKYYSSSKYGESCDHIFPPLEENATLSAVYILPPYHLEFNETFEFTVTGYAEDGRSNSTSTLIEAANSGSAQVSIASEFEKFNINDNLILNSNITSNFSVVSYWKMV
jgi:hypothetical protein